MLKRLLWIFNRYKVPGHFDQGKPEMDNHLQLLVVLDQCPALNFSAVDTYVHTLGVSDTGKLCVYTLHVYYVSIL